MTIHPEDAAMYAEQQHQNLIRIAAAIERIADVLERASDDSPSLAVRQAGAWITREDRA